MEERKSSLAEAYHIICQAWWRYCYGIGVYFNKGVKTFITIKINPYF